MGIQRSLVWLARWFNGRQDDLFQLQDLHMTQVEHHIYQKFVGRRVAEERIRLHGIELVVSSSADGGTIIHEISPPNFAKAQLDLFGVKPRFRRVRYHDRWYLMLKGEQNGTITTRTPRQA